MEDSFSSSPWLIRLCDWLPMKPAWIGICAAVGSFTAVALAFWGLDLGSIWEESQWHIDLVQSSLVGYLVAAAYYGRRGVARDFIALRPSLTCNDTEFDTWLERLRRIDRGVYIGSREVSRSGFGPRHRTRIGETACRLLGARC